MYGRRRSLGSLKSFLWYAPQLSGTSVLCFHILSFLRAHHREWLQFDGSWGQAFFSFLSFLRTHWLQSLITLTSLFTDMQEILHFSYIKASNLDTRQSWYQVILIPGNLSQLKKKPLYSMIFKDFQVPWNKSLCYSKQFALVGGIDDTHLFGNSIYNASTV